MVEARERPSDPPSAHRSHTTLSGQPVPALVGPGDLIGWDPVEHLGAPGAFPFTRGVYPSMYRGRLWTMRQFAGFGTPEETNARYRFLLERGQTGLSVAFDMPTLMGLDSDDPRAEDYSAFLGVRAVLVPDLLTWIVKPVTKIISVADAPLPVNSMLPGRAAFGDRLRDLRLFGSGARGEYGPDSDLDVLVVIAGLDHDDVSLASQIASDRSVDADVLLSLLPMTPEHLDLLRRTEQRLARDIDAEGIPL